MLEMRFFLVLFFTIQDFVALIEFFQECGARDELLSNSDSWTWFLFRTDAWLNLLANADS